MFRSSLNFTALLVGAALVCAGCDCVGLTQIGGAPADSGQPPPAPEDSGQPLPGDGGSDAGSGPDIHDPNNPRKDTDCDGLSDAEEFSTTYPAGKKTDPANADSDGDGIRDGVELGRTTSVASCGFAGDADPTTRTLPTEADSDADGLKDGVEDANRDGQRGPSETSPQQPDSDDDGLSDGAEDASADGQVDPGETDPRDADTDHDRIHDGVEKKVTRTDPVKADTDADGCPDGDEDLDQDGAVDLGESNPKLAGDCGSQATDTDQDGLPDLIEDRNGNKVFEPQLKETNFRAADTDGDGLKDGAEDKSRNGVVDPGETDPRVKDTDCDGLQDGPTQGPALGEDLNGNGAKDGSETDPTRADTDGDGLGDGLERGLTAHPEPARCPGFVGDADPATTTDPTKPDSDGDGIADGAEDANQNGRVDPPLELNPNASDATGPAAQVCTQTTLRPVVFREDGEPDVQLALPSGFDGTGAQLTPMVVGGVRRGLMGYDPAKRVAFLAFRRPAPTGATTAVADEAALRSSLAGVGAVTNPLTQSFTTWDGYPAVQAFYDQAGSADLKTRANDLAVALVGPGAGVLAGLANEAGPFRLQAEYVHRSSASLVVVLALTPTARYVEPTLFTVGDVAGGSALAQFGDANAAQCERFSPSVPKVDFLFVVDDSCSMSNSQAALGNTATAMVAALNNSSLDWRVAMVTTGYTQAMLPRTQNDDCGFPETDPVQRCPNVNYQVLRGFTTDIGEFRAWLATGSTCASGQCTQVSPATACTGGNDCWVTTAGTGIENCLESARAAVNTLTPGTAAGQSAQKGKVRADAKLVVVILGDADDQSGTTVTTYRSFFQNTGSTVGVDKNGANQPIVVHGIVCPPGASCNSEYQASPQRHAEIVAATGGVRGDINSASSITAAANLIVGSTISALGHKMSRPPMGASVKVAMNAVRDPSGCSANDLPRSRVDGFDFDGVNRTLSFYGACRPGPATTAAAVSYRYWIDGKSRPDGAVPCAEDPFFDPADPDHCKGRLTCNVGSNVCECPAGCGGTPPTGKQCNPSRYVCDFQCTPDCGGTCGGYQTCDAASCTCTCAQNATCAPGFTFSTAGGQCGCVCIAASAGCGQRFDVDLNSCACVCKRDCGGCGSGQTCNPSTCTCTGGLN